MAAINKKKNRNMPNTTQTIKDAKEPKKVITPIATRMNTKDRNKPITTDVKSPKEIAIDSTKISVKSSLNHFLPLSFVELACSDSGFSFFAEPIFLFLRLERHKRYNKLYFTD